MKSVQLLMYKQEDSSLEVRRRGAPQGAGRGARSAGRQGGGRNRGEGAGHSTGEAARRRAAERLLQRGLRGRKRLRSLLLSSGQFLPGGGYRRREGSVGGRRPGSPVAGSCTGRGRTGPVLPPRDRTS